MKIPMSQMIIENRKARFEYHIEETLEAGLCLTGSEVKSIRCKNVSIQDAFITLKKGEPYILNMKITKYQQAYEAENHEPNRDKKILLHKKQIDKLFGKNQEKGYTIIPLDIHLQRGKMKLTIALAKGKALYDKRQSIKERDLKRQERKLGDFF
jgi:SsrA-binding protein